MARTRAGRLFRLAAFSERPYLSCNQMKIRHLLAIPKIDNKSLTFYELIVL